MKLPLIVACVIAGSTWSLATAGDTATVNPKTATKSYNPQVVVGKAGKPIFASKTGNPSFAFQPTGMQQGQIQGLPGSMAVGNSDDCSTAKGVVGTGTFAFDNSAATTGTQGQAEALCNYYASTVVDNDVWFVWVAPSSGTAFLDTCSLTTVDTKIAIYDGSGCPAAAAIACVDDSCPGYQTTVSWPVVSGNSYTIQMGCFPGALGGTGSFSLTIPPPITNDDCTGPTTIVGTGVFPFDNSTATTGTQGQAEALCLFYGSTVIDSDVWYTWTAPSSGCAILDDCGGATVDTKIAVYNGSGCPTGSAIACNDDACGLQSSVRWNAVSGQTYTIQFGTYPGAVGGLGTFALNVVGAGGGQDDCASPNVIVGTGVFPFDNTAATTGCEGQGEGNCLFYGSTTVDNDIWFQWVAPATGYAVWDDCGLTTVDTKVAVYSGTGCPANGTSLACNDDACPGFQTTTYWPCTAGTTYTIQVGCFPGALGGPGSFSLDVLPPVTNDDCSAPVALAPTGPYNFHMFGATTGVQGQSEPLCLFFGSTTIDNDIWYTWTAPASGRGNLTLCGTAGFDSKVAVYSGAGCPTGAAISCNDDACGLQSQLCWPITAGQTYTIQLGTFPGAAGGLGSFDITTLPALPPCTYDDGSTENLLGWTAGGEMVWLNRFANAGDTTILSSVDVAFGSLMFPGYNPGNGTNATIAIWADGASQDGDPADATLVSGSFPMSVLVANVDTDTFNTFTFPQVTINGIFFVGVGQVHTAGQFVATMDTNCSTPGIAWFFGDNTGAAVNYTSPGTNLFPPQTFDSAGFPAQCLIRAGCASGPATYLCDPNVGGVMACPCSNPPSGSGRGCDNSSATGGASITGSGSNSLGTPTLVFTTAGERPTASSIVLQGQAPIAAGTQFGQGVRCLTTALKRLYVKAAVGGSITAPNFGGGDADIPARSAALGDTITAGTDRFYMVYYRDPVVLGTCVPSSATTFNCTNAAKVTWQP